MEFYYYIGEGPEADALLIEVRQRSETAQASRLAVEPSMDEEGTRIYEEAA